MIESQLNLPQSLAIGRYLRALSFALALSASPCITPTFAQGNSRGSSDASQGEALYVVIARLDGVNRSRRHLRKFQRALGAVPGVKVTSTRVFVEQAKGLRVEHVLPEDPQGLRRVAELLELDAVIYVEQESSGRESLLTVSVYAGEDGRSVGEQTVRVPNGRLTGEVWRAAVRAIRPELRRIENAEAVSSARRTPRRVAPVPVVADPMPRRAVRPSPEPRPVAARSRDLRRRIDSIPIGSARDVNRSYRRPPAPPLAEIQVGGMTLARTFLYTASPSSQIFTEGGINYSLGMVPGFAIDAQIAPFATQRGGIRGLGLRVLFEKAFFRTQQTVTKDDGSQTTALLDSNHMHVLAEITYRHVFRSGAEVGGFLGGGNLTFELAPNDEYQGVSYTYMTAGMLGFIPLGTKYIGFDGKASILPIAGMGDTVEELGKEATTFGYRVYLGLASRLDMGLTLSAGAEYTAFQSDVSGEGRGGRIGQSASDGFIALRFLAGYRF